VACGALAALAATGAHAQSSVTLQGMIDGGITYVNNQHGGSATLFDSGIFAPNLLNVQRDGGSWRWQQGGLRPDIPIRSWQRCNDPRGGPDFQPVGVCRLVERSLRHAHLRQPVRLHVRDVDARPLRRSAAVRRSIRLPARPVQRARCAKQPDRRLRLRPHGRRDARVQLGQIPEP